MEPAAALDAAAAPRDDEGMARAAAVTAWPAGLVYRPAIMSLDEERALIDATERDAFLELRRRAGDLAGVAPERLAEMLVTEYRPGAGIGWHRDAPVFGEVVGISLGGACRFRFRRDTEADRQTFELALEPRSAYVLAGAARWQWQHSIPPVRELRYSVTFRAVGEPGRRRATAGVG